MTKPRQLILGSASPRRRRLLSELGLTFDVMVPAVDEVFEAHRPEWTARENAQRKNAWCRERAPDAVVLTADTIVVFRSRCITKPATLEEAWSFLRAFSGNSQEVFTAVALGRPDQPCRIEVVKSSVKFRRLSDSDIDAYFAEVDPMDKAGAYDIGQRGELIIESFSGSQTNIIGLPVETVSEWLEEWLDDR